MLKRECPIWASHLITSIERNTRPQPWLTWRRIAAMLALWALVSALGLFHVHLRFLARDIQVERQLVQKQYEQLVKRQLQLETQMALVQRELEDRRERLQAELGLLPMDSQMCFEADLPRELVAKYLPAAPERPAAGGSAVFGTAQAGELPVQEIVQAIVTVIEANRPQARPQKQSE